MGEMRSEAHARAHERLVAKHLEETWTPQARVAALASRKRHHVAQGSVRDSHDAPLRVGERTSHGQVEAVHPDDPRMGRPEVTIAGRRIAARAVTSLEAHGATPSGHPARHGETAQRFEPSGSGWARITGHTGNRPPKRKR